MKKTMYVCAALFALSAATSCKKNSPGSLQKGEVTFRMDGKNYSSTYSAVAVYVNPGVLNVTTQGKLGSEIYPTQLQVTFEQAAVGTPGTSDNLTVSGSRGADTYSTHWDSQLAGSASGAVETLTATECKGTFAATVKTQSGSKTFEISDGKFWLDL